MKNSFQDPVIAPSYLFRSPDEMRDVIERLNAEFRVGEEPAWAREQTYLDTFDWRLHRCDVDLFVTPVNGALELHSKSPGGGALVKISKRMPAFARDLPEGEVRRGVGGIIDVRRLLPLIEVRTSGQTLKILDDLEKTVARIVVENATATRLSDGEAAVSLPPVVRLLPVRGYHREAADLVRFFDSERRAARDTGSPMSVYARAVGLEPGSYSSKLELKIDPGEDAIGAVCYIYRVLLDTIRINQAGTQDDLDSEFLHDFRVAIRRTRSALTQIKNVLPDSIRDHFRAEFKWLGQITGPVRDLDVFLIKMDEFREALPESDEATLEPLHRHLRKQRTVERRRLSAALRSKRYKVLLSEWQTFLSQPVDGASLGSDARLPVRTVASKRIWRAYRNVRRLGDTISEDTAAEVLHELRIDCKKLRYLLEFFRSLYPKVQMTPLVASLKQLQDNLGLMNDCAVQDESLTRIAHELEQDGIATVDCLLALGRLVEHIDVQCRDERHRFNKCYERFTESHVTERFRSLFKVKSACVP